MAFAMMDFDEEDHKKISIGNLIMVEALENILNEIRQIPHHNVEYIKSEYVENLILHHISELKGEAE